MIAAPFDYAAPTSVQEALDLLTEHGEDAKVLAGGQSLLPILRLRLNAPEIVIDLGRVPELSGVSEEGDTLVIGAMTTYADLLASEAVSRDARVLNAAVATVADPQIRHRGTLGGALVHADPAGDVGAPILALNAELVIAGQGGQSRTVSAGDFFADMFTTVVGEDELLTQIRIPKHAGWGGHYEKFVRVKHQWSVVAVAATVRCEGDTIAEASVGLTNMGSTPLRASAVEQALVGRAATEDAIRDACLRAADNTNPPSDLNADADYRKHLAGVLTRRAVVGAAQGVA